MKEGFELMLGVCLGNQRILWVINNPSLVPVEANGPGWEEMDMSWKTGASIMAAGGELLHVLDALLLTWKVNHQPRVANNCT